MNKFHDLTSFVQNDLAKKFAKLESRRKKWIMLALLFSVISFLVCSVFALSIEMDSKNLGPIVFVAILPYVLITEKYKLDIQKRVMECFLSYFDKFEYSDLDCIPDYKIVKSKLFHCNKNDAKACFSGEINSNKTTTAVTKLFFEDKESLKKELIFDGIISMSLTDGYFENLLIVMNDADFDVFEDVPRVEHESLNVFSESAEYAKKIITPEFEMWFNDIANKLGVEKYAIALFENTIFVCASLPEWQLFEFKSIYTKIAYNKKMAELYNIMTMLLGVNFLPFSLRSFGSDSTSK